MSEQANAISTEKSIFFLGKTYHGVTILKDSRGKFGAMFGDGAVYAPFESEQQVMQFIDQTLDPRELGVYES